MAEFPPPTENLSIFDYSQFMTVTGEGLTQGQADSLYLGRIGSATSTASDTSFSGLVNFNSLSSAPTCLSAPVAQTDLCNKSYVDSQAPLTAFQLFCNYSGAYGGYKLLDTNEDYTQSTLSFTTINTTPVFIAGFFNSLTTLNFGTSIPPGNWSLLCYANCASLADQSHIGLSFSIVGINSGGTETVLFSSVSTPLVSVVTSLFGCYSVTFSVPQTDISSYVSLGIKLYAIGNDSVSRTGNIQFQKTGSYTSVLTSFAVQQAPNLLGISNVWTNLNSFSSTTAGALSSTADATFHGVKFGRGGMGVDSLLIGTGYIAPAATGASNVIIGNGTCTNLLGGNYNTIIGGSAGSALTTGQFNTFIGDSAGSLTTGQDSNTCIGRGSKTATGVATGTAIGYNANCATSGTVQIGSTGANISLGGSGSTVTALGALNVSGIATLGSISTGAVGCGAITSTGTLSRSTNAITGKGSIECSSIAAYDNINMYNSQATIQSNDTATRLSLRAVSQAIHLEPNQGSVGATPIVFSTVNGLSGISTLSTTGNITSNGTSIKMTGENPIFEGTSTTSPLFVKGIAASGNAIILRANGGDVTINSGGDITTSGDINLTGLTAFIQNPDAVFGSNLTVQTVAGGGGLFLNGQGQNGILLTGTAMTIYQPTTMKQTVTMDKNAIINSVNIGRGLMIDGVLIGSGTIGNSGGAQGANNVLIGKNAGSVLTTGTDNVFIGTAAGTSIISGSNNICIGQNSSAGTAISNSIAIGVNATVTTSSTVQIGNTNATISLGGNNSLTTITGDITLSKNITLPITTPSIGTSPAQFTQLGGCNFTAFGTASNLASNTYRIVGNSGTILTPVNLPVGTYLMNGSATFNCTAGGIVTRFGVAFNTISTSFPAVDTQLATSTNFTNNNVTYAINSVTYLTSSCVVTVTTSTTYYYIAQYQAASATFTVGGCASITRIA